MYWSHEGGLTGGLVPGAERLSIALCTRVSRLDHTLVRIYPLSPTGPLHASRGSSNTLGENIYTLPLIREHHPRACTIVYRNSRAWHISDRGSSVQR